VADGDIVTSAPEISAKKMGAVTEDGADGGRAPRSRERPTQPPTRTSVGRAWLIM
jgi:hypothetical protein